MQRHLKNERNKIFMEIHLHEERFSIINYNERKWGFQYFSSKPIYVPTPNCLGTRDLFVFLVLVTFLSVSIMENCLRSNWIQSVISKRNCGFSLEALVWTFYKHSKKYGITTKLSQFIPDNYYIRCNVSGKSHFYLKTNF